MCYHKSIPAKEELKEYLKDYPVSIEDYEPFFHVSGFSHPKAPVMTSYEPHKIRPYVWGFIPFWAKNGEQASSLWQKTLNATCENLFTTPMFRAAAPRQRCLIFVDGFFEWKWSDEKGKIKTPYYIFMEGHHPFALGGIFSNWTDKKTGEIFHTYSVITTPANDLMTQIHNSNKRMPLIMPEEKWDRWLDPEAEKQEVQQMMTPFPEGLLDAWEISRDITKRGVDTNTPEVQNPASSS